MSAADQLLDEEGNPIDRDVVDKLPFTPDAKWVHMNIVETQKLQWMMGDLSDTPRADGPSSSSSSSDEKQQVRFAFDGSVVSANANLPTQTGLYHHGREETRPGYTLAGRLLLLT